MRPLTVVLGALVFTAVAALPIEGQAQKTAAPAVADVLKLTGDYLAKYGTSVSGLECEEMYVQREVSGGQLTSTRQIKSDFYLFGEGGHVDTFRDVFDVVGSAVRPHEHRLVKLFETPTPTTLQQAQQLEDAGMQNFNRELQQIPKSMGVLEYVVKANQDRSTFKIESVKKMGDAQVAILKFVEQGMPRIVDTPDHTPASGRITVDLATGAIRQTEFLLTTKMADMRVVVVYVLNPKLDLWLPASTDEHYNFTFNTAASNQATVMGSGSYNQTAAFEGRAAFSNWHKTGPGGH
jgi:hypothetical protein